ncbi:glycosyltransferase [Algoriphagus yeomjeoni]|uniref:Glycosyltransferase involved in cell wall biosynthesis n=1 Tax=Algoriphagus yeomjeoni TaxID=291403 RepID=A0A327P3E5_9BACT|nr:glycosyltransferase [Algoriphagus yeomjeoni]RAI85594.1 glycosyltransferase involved in cell wall biosynthesis [Algoriphagus yeomjeoni]
MDKPVIIYLIDGLKFGGAERSLLEIAKRIKKYRPIFCVISDSLELLEQYQKAEIQVLHFPLPRNYRFKNNAKKLEKIIRVLNPVLIHSTLFYSDMTLRYLEIGFPKVNSLVSNSYSHRRLSQLSLKMKLKVLILKLWDISSSRKVDCFVANSEVIKTNYIKETKISESKIKVIYRGRDPLQFQKLEVVNSKLSKSPRLLSVGRLIPSKGLFGLVEAFAKFLNQFPGSTLSIAGDGPEKTNLLKKIEELNLNDSVCLLGSVQNVTRELLNTDLFIFPTFYEGLPGALIEAMMAKVPVICSDIPENRECLSEDMGIFHKVGDWGDLLSVMKISMALNDWDKRTSKAFDFASKKFDVKNIVCQYEELYDQLLK